MEKLVITNKGKELLTSLVAGNKTITFTRVDISAHDYKRGEIEGLTALEEIKQTSAVSDVEKVNGDVIKVKATVDNKETEEGYYIKTVALYARMDEIEYLFGVSINPQPDFMPAKSETVTGLNLSFNIKVDNTENVSILIPSEAYASAEQVAAMRVEVDEKIEEVGRMKTKLERNVDEKNRELGQLVESRLATQQVKIEAVKADVDRLKLSLYSDMTANPFSVDFDNLEGINLTRGNHNKPLARIEC